MQSSLSEQDCGVKQPFLGTSRLVRDIIPVNSDITRIKVGHCFVKRRDVVVHDRMADLEASVRSPPKGCDGRSL